METGQVNPDHLSEHFSLALRGHLRETFRLSGPISRDIAVLSLRYPISRDIAVLSLRYCGTIAAIPHIARYFYREVSTSQMVRHPPWYLVLRSLDARNRAIVIAESLARVIAAIRIASVRWRSHLSSKPQ